jgi:hypothetical protein
VAAAFDRMAAAARRAGLDLSINSAFRSDAEQARTRCSKGLGAWGKRLGAPPPAEALSACLIEAG